MKKVSSFDRVDRYILRDYMSSLIAKGIVKGSIARKLSAVRSFYRYLMREGLIQKTHLKCLQPPSGQTPAGVSDRNRG
ncbi:Site-specific tyrosine recombinase [Dehalococcoides mccartyi]|uniref:Site-specific tyrosine recombinase n=1 Tax=Dehalococcoides mccartyi TaxID=61435 RepID=A0A328EQI4_9CHLR|nr:Site-specific tyrosine recombinase [Dehalococcoides mccartyi]